MREVTFILPYPIGLSANNSWQYSKRGIYLCNHIKTFREIVYFALRKTKRFGTEPLKVMINVFPPDKRKRDIDNVIKPILDALQKAELFVDDCQVQSIFVEKMPIQKNGKLEITVTSLV